MVENVLDDAIDPSGCRVGAQALGGFKDETNNAFSVVAINGHKLVLHDEIGDGLDVG